MKVRLLTSRLLTGGRAEQWGDVIEVSAEEARHLIAVGQAMAVEGAPAKPAPAVRPAEKQRR